MEVESVLLTGGNKGIGLEFIKQIVRLPKPPRFVFASYRDERSIQALKKIRDASKESQVVLIKLDITKKEEIESARKIVESKLGDKGLNLLINNAGAVKWKGFHDITEENMMYHFKTNTLGPVMVLKEMLPLLQKATASKTSEMAVSRAAVLNISSMAGSIGFLTENSNKLFLDVMGYRASKAALNMSMRVIALTLKDQGILIVNMCPGWVKTDMGTPDAKITTEESVSAIMKTLPKLNDSHHGSFLDRNGETILF